MTSARPVKKDGNVESTAMYVSGLYHSQGNKILFSVAQQVNLQLIKFIFQNYESAINILLSRLEDLNKQHNEISQMHLNPDISKQLLDQLKVDTEAYSYIYEQMLHGEQFAEARKNNGSAEVSISVSNIFAKASAKEENKVDTEEHHHEMTGSPKIQFKS